MAIVLTTPIVLSNIHRWKVVDFAPHKYSVPKYAELTIQILCADSTIYNEYKVKAYDVANSTILYKVGSPTGVADRLTTGLADCSGAYTAIVAADDAASGGAQAHLDALALACMSTGLVSSELAGE